MNLNLYSLKSMGNDVSGSKAGGNSDFVPITYASLKLVTLAAKNSTRLPQSSALRLGSTDHAAFD